jgi:hypothetical protein
MSTWNWEKINETHNIYIFAKERGMKTMGIVAYAPRWLTFTGTNFGVPKDWEVFDDLVRKLYKYHRPYLDYLEVWNEAETKNFLNVSGSGLTPNQAYALLFTHISKVVREVDREMNDGKTMQIGVAVAAAPMHISLLETILSTPNLKKEVNFVSYHNYGFPEPSDKEVKKILTKYQVEKLPIFLTEWNKSPDEKDMNVYNTTDIAISYTGTKLLQLMNMGMNGANYFSTTFNNINKPNTVFGTYGIYQVINGELIPLPQTKTWKLLSSTLSLGDGQSKIVFVENKSGLAVTGFINSEGVYGFAISNEKPSIVDVNVRIKNSSLNGNYTAVAYEASARASGDVQQGSTKVTFENSKSELKVLVPNNSVVGVLFKDVGLF